MDNSIPTQKRQQLKQKFKNNKKAIEALLKQFHYQQKLSLNDNMKKLCTCLENVLNIDHFYDFSNYLNKYKVLVPLVRAIKYENLISIFQDWLATKDQFSLGNIQRFPTRKHRNILFKRIFLEQKQTINDYFQVISQKKKLKGMDLFQLLTQILGSYYLYEFNSDRQTYFQKINIFESFIKVVQSYVKSSTRIYSKDLSNPGDENYVRLYQFQALIQFWEKINPQLTLQQQPRRNLQAVSVQTTPVNLVNSSTQTQKQHSRNYLLVINNFLRQINSLIQIQNDADLLGSLDRVFECLKTEKLFAVSYNQKNQKKTYNQNRFLISSQYSQAQQMIIKPSSPKNKNRMSPQKPVINNHLLSPEKEEDDAKIIFKYLCSLDTLHCLSLNGLNNFLSKLGIIENNENLFVNNLLYYGYIEDKEDINLKEFKTIIRQLMKENRKFTNLTLKSFITNYVESNNLKKTAYFKNNNDSNLKEGNLLSSSLINRDRSYSRTTFPMDSEGSVL